MKKHIVVTRNRPIVYKQAHLAMPNSVVRGMQIVAKPPSSHTHPPSIMIASSMFAIVVAGIVASANAEISQPQLQTGAWYAAGAGSD